MQNNDSLYELIRFVASADSTTADAPVSGQLEALHSLFETQASVTRVNTQAISDNTKTQNAASASGSPKTGASTLTGGLLLSPILSGLLKLFGGGSSDEAPAPLEKFALPAVRIQAGLSPGTHGLSAVDYGQAGLPRPVATAPAANVTLQVNAMDSRSFLDRSEDIAIAVRRAMLESSALNDVVSEL